LSVMLLRFPVAATEGNIASRFRAPLACVIVKLRVFPLHAIEPNDDELRPSSQVSIC
jgi:hypothetical protein